jgi:NTP pyrophosphatase (non-canonical NTP hydrolase)
MDIHALTTKLFKLSQQYTTRYNIERSEEWVVLKLTEEVGEFVQAFLQCSQQSRKEISAREAKSALEDELADVLGMVLVASKEFDLDIEAGLHRKWFRHQEDNERSCQSIAN